jgi:hypothetical protein
LGRSSEIGRHVLVKESARMSACRGVLVFGEEEEEEEEAMAAATAQQLDNKKTKGKKNI